MRTVFFTLALFSICLVGAQTTDASSLTPETRHECGECHPAFPPEALSVRQWHAILRNLSNHYGEDASLSPKTLQQVRENLLQQAGPEVDASTPLLVSNGAWWRNRHQKLAQKGTRKRKGIRMDNCVACHELSSYETPEKPVE